MIAKWLSQTLIWIVAMGALLFVPAGTLHWLAAWVFLATLAVIGLLGGWWLARTDPALLAERMRPLMRAEQPAADKKFIVVRPDGPDLAGRHRARYAPAGLRCPDRAAGDRLCHDDRLQRLHHVGVA